MYDLVGSALDLTSAAVNDTSSWAVGRQLVTDAVNTNRGLEVEFVNRARQLAGGLQGVLLEKVLLKRDGWRLENGVWIPRLREDRVVAPVRGGGQYAQNLVSAVETRSDLRAPAQNQSGSIGPPDPLLKKFATAELHRFVQRAEEWRAWVLEDERLEYRWDLRTEMIGRMQLLDRTPLKPSTLAQ